MFRSTRSNEEVKGTIAILQGISSDGGLYVPDDIHPVNMHEIRNFSYRQLTTHILRKYFDEFDLEDLEEIVSKAFNNRFDTFSIIDIKKTNDCYFMELFHGDTLAFKDIPLSVLPYLILKSKQLLNLNTKTMILTATSGDTGSASLSAFSKVEDISSFVIYPNNGVSSIQEKQMLSSTNDSNFAIALEGSFDDALKVVKNIFADIEFKKSLKNVQLTSSNSINVARMVLQIVYYFYSYILLLRRREIENGEKVNFVVPTGNFGNILAGYLAKRMGLPVNKLICASNTNNVLTEFFNTGVYNLNRKVEKTYSPSMDILNSSNLERLLYFLISDVKKVKNHMESLANNKFYRLEILSLLKDFKAFYTTEEETLQGINQVFTDNQYLIDPHTSVAYMAYKKYLAQNDDKTKTVVLATAHPYKFPQTIMRALKLDYTIDDFDNLRKLEQYTQVKIPKQLNNLEKLNTKAQTSSSENIYHLFKEKVKLCD